MSNLKTNVDELSDGFAKSIAITGGLKPSPVKTSAKKTRAPRPRVPMPIRKQFSAENMANIVNGYVAKGHLAQPAVFYFTGDKVHELSVNTDGSYGYVTIDDEGKHGEYGRKTIPTDCPRVFYGVPLLNEVNARKIINEAHKMGPPQEEGDDVFSDEETETKAAFGVESSDTEDA